MSGDYTYRQLLQQYHHTQSLREKTRIEEALWNELSADQRRNYHTRIKFLKTTLGGTLSDYTNRMYLFNAKDTKPLWNLIEKGSMKLGTAVRLHRTARRIAIKRDIAIAAALSTVLAEYSQLPERTDGVRRRNPTSLARRKTPHNFWHNLRTQVADHVRRELPDGEIPEIESLSAQLETDIKVAIETFQARLRSVKKRAATDHAVTRRKLREAFETLLLEPPRRGKPIDIGAVRKNKRRLAREYHPDRNAGNDDMIEAYHAVIDAAALIEDEYENRKTS